MIPTRGWVLALMAERDMPQNIVRHSTRVMQVAMAVAVAMRRAGKDLDLALIDRSALLHDICKADSIARGGDHALMGQHLLESLGYPLVGDIVGQHIHLRSMEVNEAMVVNYADKRVMHDRVVSLETRFLDLMDRYSAGGKNTERILQHFAHVREIEEAVITAVGIEPESLEALNLVPGDHPLDGGDGLGGEDGPVEEHDHHVDLERVDHDEPVEIDE